MSRFGSPDFWLASLGGAASGAAVVALALAIVGGVPSASAGDAAGDVERDAQVASLEASRAAALEDAAELRQERDALAAEVRRLELAAADVPDLSCVWEINGGCLTLDQVLERMVSLDVYAAQLEDEARQATLGPPEDALSCLGLMAQGVSTEGLGFLLNLDRAVECFGLLDDWLTRQGY